MPSDQSPGLTSGKSHVRIVAHSHCKPITWLRDRLRSNCNSNTEVHNDKVFIIELQIKSTSGGENYNYNYCTRKTVIIT